MDQNSPIILTKVSEHSHLNKFLESKKITNNSNSLGKKIKKSKLFLKAKRNYEIKKNRSNNPKFKTIKYLTGTIIKNFDSELEKGDVLQNNCKKIKIKNKNKCIKPLEWDFDKRVNPRIVYKYK